jgi:hypothetical protein
MTGRERKETEMIMVKPIAVRWARTAVSGFAEIIDRLL